MMHCDYYDAEVIDAVWEQGRDRSRSGSQQAS